MSATTSEPPRGLWIALLLVVALAAAGLPRLVVDPLAPFRLPGGDPVEIADRALRASTGGDDLVALVVWDERGPLDAAGIGAVDALLEALLAEPALVRSRAVTRAPILSGAEGVLTAVTPLHPTPAPDDLEAALRTVLADPFAVGALVTPDGSMAMLPSWIARAPADEALVAIAGKALADPAVRATEDGRACGQAVDQARLAVVLGDAAGPADAEVGRRLEALAEAGNALAAGWARRAKELADDPEGQALEAVRRASTSVALPDGLTVAVLGEAALRDELAERFPLGVGVLVAGLLIGLLAAGAGASRWRGPLLATAGVTAVAGGMGWAGAPLHGQTALMLPLAALLPGASAGGGATTWRTALAVAPLVGLGAALTGTPGALAGALLAAGAVLGAGLLAPSAPEARQSGPREPASRAALLVLAAGLALSGSRPLGLNPARQLDGRSELGRVTAALDRFGMGAPAQIALLGDAPRALALPAGLEALARGQSALQADRSVLATVSWADFVARLHGVVSGGTGLPDDAALVDQYLLLFGRPDDVRPLVAPDFRVGGGILRLRAGEGAALGRLAGPVGDTGAIVTGGAARVARAGWLAARRAGLGAALAAVLAALLLAFVGGGRTRALSGLAAAAVAVGACGAWVGAVGVEAALAGAGAWCLTLQAPPRGRLAGLGGLCALLSPVCAVAGFGLGLAAGAACGAILGGRDTEDGSA